MDGAAQGRRSHGVDVVIDFVERHRGAYEVIEHRDTLAATSEARASGTAPERMGKTVLLHDHDGFRVAVIPASEQLDLHKAICGWRARMRSNASFRRSTLARCRHSARYWSPRDPRQAPA